MKEIGFEVLTAMAMKNTVFWYVTPCSLCSPEYGVSTLLQNIG
jgi:hypothetical protein